VNQTGSINVLDAASRGGGVPVVYASSAAVYGDNPAPRIGEGEVPRPLNPYGADKLGSELHARVGWVIHRLPTVGLRFFNVFGPRQDPGSPYSGVISRFLDRTRQGAPLTIHGDGQQTRDFVYVDDVVAHLVAAMAMVAAAPGPHVMNVCTGRSVTIADLARVIGDVAGSPVAIEYGPARAGEIIRSCGDPELATRTLGVAAKTTLRDGLRETLAALSDG
jgi:UDP-glucose 4-epimerase